MPNRFKFQGPEGSIIMEFDDNCTVFQVRTLLSQTIDRKVLGLVAAADKLSGGSAGTNQSQHSVIRLLDSQRMKEVDRKVVMMLECEKLAMMTSEGVNKKEPSEGQEAKSGEMETSSTSNGKLFCYIESKLSLILFCIAPSRITQGRIEDYSGDKKCFF